MNVQEQAAKTLSQYTGRKIKAKDVQVFADPNVPDVYAVRVREDEHYLLHGFNVEGVEEVMFSTWPPRSR